MLENSLKSGVTIFVRSHLKSFSARNEGLSKDVNYHFFQVLYVHQEWPVQRAQRIRQYRHTPRDARPFFPILFLRTRKIWIKIIVCVFENRGIILFSG